MIRIYLNDSKMNYESAQVMFVEADLWAQENCKTYQGFDVQDVSDHSYTMDQVAMYVFEDDRDANWFILRWSR